VGSPVPSIARERIADMDGRGRPGRLGGSTSGVETGLIETPWEAPGCGMAAVSRLLIAYLSQAPKLRLRQWAA
jgi:hypothetical protein